MNKNSKSPLPRQPRPDAKTGAKKSVRNKEDVKIYGRHACRALWKNRPNDILRIYLHEKLVREFRDVLKWCADTKHAYHLVQDDDLDRVAASGHHEGICILSKRAPMVSPDDLQSWCDREEAMLVYLDGIGNPHNFGTVLRNAAHFGVDLVLGQAGELPTLSGAASRVAEGGAEHTKLMVLDDGRRELSRLQEAGYTIVCADSHVRASLYKIAFPKKTILVLGGERDGVSKPILKLADAHVQIPGTGNVESLNISSASAILFSEYRRQHQIAAAKAE